MSKLSTSQCERLGRFARTLINQESARTIVEPIERASGFWFGGGNLCQAPDGRLVLCGRYRNAGDSRTGLSAGERGFELAVFCADDGDSPFKKTIHFSKSDLTFDEREVVSIEGSALRLVENGVELYVSSEKKSIPYPEGLEAFLKPGTGVWTIDVLRAASLDELKTAQPKTLIASADPGTIHVKDPFLYQKQDGEVILLFCSHPFCWTSSNTGHACLAQNDGTANQICFDFFPRGLTWDVAMTRGTCLLPVPRVGRFTDEQVTLMFYDGGECVRDHDQHQHAVTRPRGFSCEELGGLAYIVNDDFDSLTRLSTVRPMFVSPHGTGCSRYVDVLAGADGYYATWQQSQDDGSQPLVMNFVPYEDAIRVLS